MSDLPSTQLERVFEIEAILSEGRAWTARQLAKRLDANLRTIQRDLEFLRLKWEDKFEDDGRRRYKIRPAPRERLNDVEALATYIAARLLTHHGLADGHHRKALRKLANNLPEPAKSHLNRCAERPVRDRESERSGVLEKVARAWFSHRALKCVYTSAGGNARPRRLAIYFVEMGRRNHFPYVLAIDLDHVQPEVRVYRLSRMTNVRVTDEVVTIPEGFDPDAFLGDAWGIINGTPIRIRVRMDPSLEDSFRDSAGDAVRSAESTADGKRILEVAATFDDGAPFEVLPWLLSWGDGIEVLGPDEVRTQVADAAKRIVATYASESNQP